MPALPPTGLARNHINSSRRSVRIASPTRSSTNKFTCFRSTFSLTSDTSPSSLLEADRSTRFSTHLHADRRQPRLTYHQSETAGDRDRPAAQPAARRGNCVRRAERAERVTSSRRSCQRASAASSPERPPSAPRRADEIDQPEARACPRPGTVERHSRPKGGPPQRCGAGRCGPRWSA